MSILDGDFDNTLRLSDELQDTAEEIRAGNLAGQLSDNLAVQTLLYLGNFDNVLGRIDARHFEVHWSAPQRAYVLAVAGRREEATVALLEQMERLGVPKDGPFIPTPLLLHLLKASVAVGDKPTAKVLLEFVKTLPPMAYTALQLVTSPTRLLAETHAFLGDRNEARRRYNQALEVCGKARFRPEIALTRLGLAELLLEHYPDERDAAIGHLDFAIAEFRDMKMQPSLERALRHRGLLKA
jgi:hypothetical protein